nr:MAG TPA: hypothetical protein [Caudoviricetes sp.]
MKPSEILDNSILCVELTRQMHVLAEQKVKLKSQTLGALVNFLNSSKNMMSHLSNMITKVDSIELSVTDIRLTKFYVSTKTSKFEALYNNIKFTNSDTKVLVDQVLTLLTVK